MTSPYNQLTGAKVGSKGSVSSGVQGLVSGASVGASVGGVKGAIIGAAVGAIGGIFSGRKADKSAYYQRLASQVQRQREYNQLYAQQLQHVRSLRSARADSIAAASALGVSDSSLSSGSLSSMGSQSAYTLQTVGEDVRLQELYNSYMTRAKKSAMTAEDINQWTNLIFSGLSAYNARSKELQEDALREQARQQKEQQKLYLAEIEYQNSMLNAEKSLVSGISSGSAYTAKKGELYLDTAKKQALLQQIALRKQGLAQARYTSKIGAY